MAHLILANQSIKGISVNEIVNVMCQFADDTNLFLEYDYDTLNAVCETLEQVEAAIGLKISYKRLLYIESGL